MFLKSFNYSSPSALKPRFIYVVAWYGIEKELIKFSLDRLEILKLIKEKPYKYFLIFEHKKFLNCDDWEGYPLNYLYESIRSVNTFYPEEKPEEFFPEQEWFLENLDYLKNKFQRQNKFTARKICPQLFFLMTVESGLTDIFIDENPVVEYTSDWFVKGEITWQVQELNWFTCKSEA